MPAGEGAFKDADASGIAGQDCQHNTVARIKIGRCYFVPCKKYSGLYKNDYRKGGKDRARARAASGVKRDSRLPVMAAPVEG